MPVVVSRNHAEQLGVPRDECLTDAPRYAVQYVDQSKSSISFDLPRLKELSRHAIDRLGSRLSQTESGRILLDRLHRVIEPREVSRASVTFPGKNNAAVSPAIVLRATLEALHRECPESLRGYSQYGVTPELISAITGGRLPPNLRFPTERPKYYEMTNGKTHQNGDVDIFLPRPNASDVIASLGSEASFPKALRTLLHEFVHRFQDSLLTKAARGQATLLVSSAAKPVVVSLLVGAGVLAMGANFGLATAAGAATAVGSWIFDFAKALRGISRVALACESQAFVTERVASLPGRIPDVLKMFSCGKHALDHAVVDFAEIAFQLESYAVNVCGIPAETADRPIHTTLESVVTCVLLGVSAEKIARAANVGKYSPRRDRHSHLANLADRAVATYGISPKDPADTAELRTAISVCMVVEAMETRRRVQEVIRRYQGNGTI